jgi:hypothetical protein
LMRRTDIIACFGIGWKKWRIAAGRWIASPPDTKYA